VKDPREDLSALWMVPYADLMTTLVILFLALFAYSYANKPPEFEVAVAKMQQEVASRTSARITENRAREAELALKLKEEMDRLALKDFGINISAHYVRIVLPSPVLFSEGSAILGSEAGRILRPLAELFAQVENPILVEGHTDNLPIVRGIHRNNWELSAARAFSIIDFFVRRGMNPARFQARGLSEYRPAASNETPEGRGRNRRIEISLAREIQEEEPRP